LPKKLGKAFTSGLLIALVILAIIRLGDLRQSAKASKYQSRIMMDTVVSIRIHRGDAGNIDQAMEAAFDDIGRLDGLLSAWSSGSDISRINRAAGQSKVAVDPDTWRAVKRIQELSALTGGAFDITIGAVLQLWDFSSPESSPPPAEDVAAQLALVGSGQVQLDETTQKIGLRHRGASIDLGGAAKGFIVDRAVEMLQELGVEAAIVDAGGDIRLLGTKRRGESWKIGIKHPQDPATTIEVIEVDSGAVATSGNYERSFSKEGIRYHHILDPKTGFPAPDVASVTILAPTALEADLLSTAVFVLGPEEGLRLIERLAGIEGIIYAEGRGELRRIASSGFPEIKEQFKLSEGHFSPRRS
jgi:thiamine biosynthesis lipoprotein